jgi:hypothetical protein
MSGIRYRLQKSRDTKSLFVKVEKEELLDLDGRASWKLAMLIWENKESPSIFRTEN